ncbi:uncharacterized protein LOC143522623 [Brachyhypopomus gauderio]|uniref:uncharacterized protein LOC143522623 n=1 Tax=Brachyhypopomus gauderio TaxID=698409 RepID=UPI00404360D5
MNASHSEDAGRTREGVTLAGTDLDVDRMAVVHACASPAVSAIQEDGPGQLEENGPNRTEQEDLMLSDLLRRTRDLIVATYRLVVARKHGTRRQVISAAYAAERNEETTHKTQQHVEELHSQRGVVRVCWRRECETAPGMMECLCLLFVVLHFTAGCILSGVDKTNKVKGHTGGSVLLSCSCTDLQTQPQSFTWWTLSSGHWTDVFSDERYRDRVQRFNKLSPRNLSLLITDLRTEDEGEYRCYTGSEHGYIKYFTLRVSGCMLSGHEREEVKGHTGGSVLLSCSCTDLQTRPQRFTWWTWSGGTWTEVFRDEHYRDRVQWFNELSPGNLSLLITDLRKEDERDYSCETESEHRYIRDFTLHVSVSPTVNVTSGEPPDLQTTVLSMSVLLLLVLLVLAFIYWRHRVYYTDQ